MLPFLFYDSHTLERRVETLINFLEFNMSDEGDLSFHIVDAKQLSLDLKELLTRL